jgi:hypothetical protein
MVPNNILKAGTFGLSKTRETDGVSAKQMWCRTKSKVEILESKG